MKFKSERDFSITALTVSILLLLALLMILARDEGLAPLLVGGLSAGFLSWVVFGIEYVFKEKYLYIKGGPIRKKIRYEDITRIKRMTDPLFGFRIMGSTNGIEICYKNALMGSIKISPVNRDVFIDELVKRNPSIIVEDV